MIKTVMTPSLVVKYANLEVTHPVCDFHQIRTFELSEARRCFGEVLYTAMLEDLAEYPEATEYSSTINYNAGAVVIYDFTLFRALEPSTGVLPVDPTKWELAPRFQTDCYNVLFCTVMAEYLAWIIVRHRLPFINTKISGTGLVKLKSSSFESANEHDYNSLMAAAAKMVQMTWENFEAFIIANKDNTCYAGFKSFLCTGCNCIKSQCKCSYKSTFVYTFA